MDDQLLRDFLAESGENLVRIDQDLVALERDPGDTERLNAIFRNVHTIKGTCGFLGLERLEAVSHTAESVLDLLRSGALGGTPEVISDVLAAVDVIRGIVGELARSGREPAGDDTAVVAALERWLGEVVPAGGGDLPAPAVATVTHELPGEPAPGESLQQAPAPARTGMAESVAAAMRELGPIAAPGSLRVSVSLLDTLMNLAGELVLARNQLLQLAGTDAESVYAAPIQQLNRVTAELQDAVMRTRMQPVGTAWGKLPRVVRDIARDAGKRIELNMKGADTELDRQLVQALQDPLTHMIRNSADHGIESPAARRAAGKPETGTITLHAFHESGQVIVEVRDDGAGIDAAKVRRRAVERGLVREDVAASLSDQQVLRFVFEPGFSTADAVTHVSGRGVGMDVVRNNIERVGGTVELRSVRGAGTTVRMRLPLTLAIVPALLVSVADETFAIPQASIVELIRLSGSGRALERVGDTTVLRLRDTLLPVVCLGDLLHVPRGGDAAAPDVVVVCHAGDTRFGLLVGDVIDTLEIVVKPIGRRIRHIACYAGCTILGDGRVVTILDTAGVMSMAGFGGATRVLTPAVAESAARRESVLLFDGGSSALQGVPLALVARLEEIPPGRIEEADGRYLVQYRGSLLPIVPATSGVTVTAGRSSSVIVFNDGGTSFGIAVNAIRDIVEDTLRIELEPSRPEVLGTAVVGGSAVEILDATYFLARARAKRSVS